MKKLLLSFLSLFMLMSVTHQAWAEGGTKKSLKVLNGSVAWGAAGNGFVNQVGEAGALPTALDAPAGGKVLEIKNYITTPPVGPGNAPVTYSTSSSSSICTVDPATGQLLAKATGTCVVTVNTPKVEACMTCDPKIYPVAAGRVNLTFAITGTLSSEEQLAMDEMGVLGTGPNEEGKELDLTKVGGGITYRAYKAANGAERFANGSYPAKVDFTGTMPQLDWASGGDLQGPVLGTGQRDFVGAQFEGYILWPGSRKATTPVVFYDVCDDGFKLKIAKEAGAAGASGTHDVVINNYVDQAPGSWSSRYNATGTAGARKGGSIYHFTIDYYEHGGHAMCSLYWDKGKGSAFPWSWMTKKLVPAKNFSQSPTHWNTN